MIKVGGLADVAAALSKALRLLGHKVTIALPRFPALEAGGLMLARRLTPLRSTWGLPQAGLPHTPGGRGDPSSMAAGLRGRVCLGRLDSPGLRSPGSTEKTASTTRTMPGASAFNRAVVEIVRQRARTGRPRYRPRPTGPRPWSACSGERRRLAGQDPSDHPQPGPTGRTRPTRSVHGLGREHFTTERLEFYGQVNLKGGSSRPTRSPR
jgi:starch synthase